MPICGTQLAEWFCERGILAATSRLRPPSPLSQCSIRRSTDLGTLACDRGPDHRPVRARRQPRSREVPVERSRDGKLTFLGNSFERLGRALNPVLAVVALGW